MGFGSLASIVDNLPHDTTEVAMALSVIEVPELGRSLVQARVGRWTGKVSIAAYGSQVESMERRY